MAEDNKNQPLITINLVKMHSLKADTKVEHTTLTSKQFHVFVGCYINKTFDLCTIQRHKIHEQSTFSRPFIFVFNSRIDSLF